MKKILFLAAAVSTLIFAGCSKQDDMSSPPASSGTSTNSASTNK